MNFDVNKKGNFHGVVFPDGKYLRYHGNHFWFSDENYESKGREIGSLEHIISVDRGGLAKNFRCIGNDNIEIRRAHV